MAEAKLTVIEQMAQLYRLFGYEEQIIWDRYRLSDRFMLKEKLKTLICDSDENSEAKNKKLETVRDDIFNAIWKQRVYNQHHDLLMFPSFVALVPIEEYKNSGLNSKEYCIYPVFRIRRCIRNEENDIFNEGSRGCCMIFVDIFARVYHSWNQFKNNNKLPEGYIIAPTNGILTKSGNEVQLECFISPASSDAAKAVRITDVGTSVLGLAASGVMMAGTLFTTVAAAPLVLPAAAACAIGTGVYGTARSIGTLVDRGQHEQSNGLDNAEARSSIIGAVGGILSVGAGAATKTLSFFARTTGSAPAVARVIVNGINVSTMTVNGLGIVNGGYAFIIRFRNDENITAFEFIQFSASLALFTHSLYNFRTAGSIIEEGRQGFLKDYAEGLSNRQQKGFNRLLREMTEFHGSEKQAQRDLVRAIRKTAGTKQVFRDIYAMKGSLTRNGVKLTGITPEGKLLLNNQAQFGSNTLRNNPVLLKAVPTNGTDVSANLTNTSTTTQLGATLNGTNVVTTDSAFRPMDCAKIAVKVSGIISVLTPFFKNKIPKNLEQLQEVLTEMLMNLKEVTVDYFINFLKEFVLEFVNQIEDALGIKMDLDFYIRQAFDEFRRMANDTLDYFIMNLDLVKARDHLLKFFCNRDNFSDLFEDTVVVVLSPIMKNCESCGGFYYSK